MRRFSVVNPYYYAYCQATALGYHELRIITDEGTMTDSVYRSIEPVGTSAEAWETAAANPVETASETQLDPRIAWVIELDMQVRNGRVTTCQSKNEPFLQVRR